MKHAKKVPQPRVNIPTTYTHILTIQVADDVTREAKQVLLTRLQRFLDKVTIGETVDYSTVNIHWTLPDPNNLARYHADCRMFGDYAVLYHTERMFEWLEPLVQPVVPFTFEITKPLSIHTVLQIMELSEIDERERSGTGSSHENTDSDTERGVQGNPEEADDEEEEEEEDDTL